MGSVADRIRQRNSLAAHDYRGRMDEALAGDLGEGWQQRAQNMQAQQDAGNARAQAAYAQMQKPGGAVVPREVRENTRATLRNMGQDIAEPEAMTYDQQIASLLGQAGDANALGQQWGANIAQRYGNNSPFMTMQASQQAQAQKDAEQKALADRQAAQRADIFRRANSTGPRVATAKENLPGNVASAPMGGVRPMGGPGPQQVNNTGSSALTQPAAFGTWQNQQQQYLASRSPQQMGGAPSLTPTTIPKRNNRQSPFGYR